MVIYCALIIGLFSYDLVTVNECLSDTLEKEKSGTSSSLQVILKDNLNFYNLKMF